MKSDSKVRWKPTYKRVCFVVVLLSTLTIGNLQSQITLVAKEQSGAQSFFQLINISKITFEAGNLLVHKTNEMAGNFQLSNLRYMNFKEVVTESLPFEVIENSRVHLFPNPASTNLNISFEERIAGKVQVEVIDLQGKVLYQLATSSHIGEYILTLSIEQLSPGMYILRIQNGNEFEALKFCKN